MQTKILLIISVLSISSIGMTRENNTVVAFSYFQNRSEQHEYDYLSKILPNSLADSFKSNFAVTPIKPSDIDEKFRNENSEELKPYYIDYDLPGLARKIPQADYIIYGYYIPNDNGSIEIVSSVYNVHSMEVFTFSTFGKMETELFILVDRVIKSYSTMISSDIMYMESKIPNNSKLAFLTNLDGNDLNLVMSPFFDKGFSIISVQSNELYSSLPDDQLLGKLKYTALAKTSFDKVRTDKIVKFNYSIANNTKVISYSKSIQNLISTYYYGFPKQHDEYLKNVSKKYSYKIDFLFVLMFDKKSKSASLQCFDLRRYGASLIWFQTGIRGTGSGSYINQISHEIISQMDKYE